MSVRGDGGSLGEALLAAVATAAGSDHPGRYRSYTAMGWHAQLAKLTSSDRGYQAAADAGLSATAKTLRAWLAESQVPTTQNQRKIADAYARMAGRWPAATVEGREIRITGVVKIGSDVRTRGTGGHAPLVVDGSAGDWSRLRERWEEGDPDPDAFEEDWIEDILEADLGETTEAWEFPGTAYTVVIG